jgi:hypothetical protein
MLRIALLSSMMMLMVQPSSGRLQGTIGLWVADSTDASVIVTDGAHWSGQTSRSALSAAATPMFGSISEPFLVNGSSPNAFPVAIDRRTTDFRDGTMRVQFKLIAGPTDQSAGIVFGMQATGAYHFVRYNTKDGNLALWTFTDGDRRVLAKGAGLKQLPLQSWHELVVTVRGSEVTASVTGHRELDARFSLAAPVTGRVGVWAKRDVVTAFRGFAVEAAR